jgi:hypothetical protein
MGRAKRKLTGDVEVIVRWRPNRRYAAALLLRSNVSPDLINIEGPKRATEIIIAGMLEQIHQRSGEKPSLTKGWEWV